MVKSIAFCNEAQSCDAFRKPPSVVRRQKFGGIMAGRATERLFSPLSASVKPRQALN